MPRRKDKLGSTCPLCGSACVAHDGDTWRCFAKGHTFIRPTKRWIVPSFVTQLLALSAEARAAFERAVGRRAA